MAATSTAAEADNSFTDSKNNDLAVLPGTKDNFSGATVAKHYNELEECGRKKRTESRIFYMRNFNNWIKSMLIKDLMDEIKKKKKVGDQTNVMDLCCGKGGDLLKWRKAGIHHLICADIAGTSIEQCLDRYEDNAKKCKGKIFSAEFITCDCTKVRLKDYLKHPDRLCDLVSCQFSFHYCFESYGQVDLMLRNVSENLRPGGYFIGTIPDAYEIVKRLKSSNTNSFGNDIYRVTFPEDGNKTNFNLFGARYDFHLEGVVDCPEFLVYFPLLEKLAEKYNLKLFFKKSFSSFAEENFTSTDGRELLERMQAMETYPSDNPVGNKDIDYEYAEAMKQQADNSNAKFGTLSKEEWEAISLYLVFAFVKSAPDQIPLTSTNSLTSESAPKLETMATVTTINYAASKSRSPSPSAVVTSV